MGLWIEFRCKSCGYEAMVSGRDDMGEIADTTTILCEDCEELYDVITFRRTKLPEEESRLGPIEPECPKAAGHAFRRWEDPDACPKCGNPMTHGEKWTIWD